MICYVLFKTSSSCLLALQFAWKGGFDQIRNILEADEVDAPVSITTNVSKIQLSSCPDLMLNICFDLTSKSSANTCFMFFSVKIYYSIKKQLKNNHINGKVIHSFALPVHSVLVETPGIVCRVLESGSGKVCVDHWDGTVHTVCTEPGGKRLQGEGLYHFT